MKIESYELPDSLYGHPDRGPLSYTSMKLNTSAIMSEGKALLNAGKSGGMSDAPKCLGTLS